MSAIAVLKSADQEVTLKTVGPMLNSPECRWHSLSSGEIQCWFAGADEIARRLIVLCQSPRLSPDKVGELLAGFHGTFAVVVQCPAAVIAAADKIRSTPIFYTEREGSLVLSNSARMLRDAFGLVELDPLSGVEFRMAGYVTGRETLMKGLKQIQAGEMLIWDKERRTSIRKRYYLFYHPAEKVDSFSAGMEELEAVTEQVFRHTVERLAGRPALIPLSGGLDSRLNACMLKRCGYDNVVCYSYGLDGNWESRASRDIASRLGFRWIFVPYDKKAYRKLYRDPDTAAYFEFGDGLCSLPFVQDRLCLLKMRDKGLIPHDAVFINGNSGDFSTGGHIPETLMQSMESGRRWDSLFQSIVKKHYSLWDHRKTPGNLGKIETKIRFTLEETLGRDLQDLDDLCLCSLHELWEWQERQCKFVVNGQRVYDYLGYAWMLPHWDELYLDFWRRVSPSLKFEQRLYKYYLEKEDHFGLFRNFRPGRYIKPSWIRPLRTAAKWLTIPFGRDAWHRIEKNFFAYFTDNLQTYCAVPYRKVALARNRFRNALSFRSEDYYERIATEFGGK